MQSSNPCEGNESSNISIILISSVSSSLDDISSRETEKFSVSARSIEYFMEHFPLTRLLILSKPSLCSVLKMSEYSFSIPDSNSKVQR